MAKIKTTVYDHKVIDVLDFSTGDNVPDWTVEELMNDLYLNIISSMDEGSGRVRVKVDRPLSQADREHRLGVVAKNSLAAGRRGFNWRERYDYEHYLRLKARFESA